MEPSERAPRKLGAEKLWEYALRVLGARAQSLGELRRKLEERAQRPEDVPAMLARLRQYGYLDDRRFAEGFSTARLENQGLGKERVLRDLRRRRVAPRLAEEAVRTVYRDTDETRLIEQYLRRKYRRVQWREYLAEPKNLAAVYRRLRHAGFSAAGILRVLTRWGADADWLASAEEPAGSET
jgi:regulatory protein